MSVGDPSLVDGVQASKKIGPSPCQYVCMASSLLPRMKLVQVMSGCLLDCGRPVWL